MKVVKKTEISYNIIQFGLKMCKLALTKKNEFHFKTENWHLCKFQTFQTFGWLLSISYYKNLKISWPLFGTPSILHQFSTLHITVTLQMLYSIMSILCFISRTAACVDKMGNLGSLFLGNCAFGGKSLQFWQEIYDLDGYFCLFLKNYTHLWKIHIFDANLDHIPEKMVTVTCKEIIWKESPL